MCDWCNNEKYDDTYYGNSDFDKEFEIAEGSWTSLYMLHNSKTNKYGMYASGDGEAVVNINFCPNCGRKL